MSRSLLSCLESSLALMQWDLADTGVEGGLPWLGVTKTAVLRRADEGVREEVGVRQGILEGVPVLLAEATYLRPGK